MRAALAALAVLAACGRSERAAPAQPPVATTAPAPSTPDAGAASAIPAATGQLVTAIVDDWDATTAELRLWARDGAHWRPVGAPWPGVIGRAGSAWGAGLHGAGAPAGRGGPVKREGDGKSPAGVFGLTASYGYAAAAPAGAALPYTSVDAAWKCVDDPASRHYNQILDQRAATIDWTSAEDMRRRDALYTWVVEIAHNPARATGAGSCVFLHVWGGPRSTTAGCTAMDEARLAALLGALDPARAPAFVLLPRAEYRALAAAWALPAL